MTTKEFEELKQRVRAVERRAVDNTGVIILYFFLIATLFSLVLNP